jgi:hypothetical protein
VGRQACVVALVLHCCGVRLQADRPPVRLKPDTTHDRVLTRQLALPGAAGRRLELVGTPPRDLQIVDVFVYSDPAQAAPDTPRPNRFPSGLTSLTLDIRVKELRRLGTTIRFEVLSRSGAVEMSDGLFSFSERPREGVASMEFDLRPKIGQFADGPYQLKLFMDDRLIAILNWSVGSG